MSQLFGEPYTLKRTTTRLLGHHTYSIMFEETNIASLTANKEFAENIVSCLNGAWNLGFGTGKIEGELSVKHSNREQKLVDIACELAIVAAKLHSSSTEDQIVGMVAKELGHCGFPTIPQGSSRRVLCNLQTEKASNEA